MGVKPGDNWTVPLCEMHHTIQHVVGEAKFEADFALRMKDLAAKMWAVSPAGKRYRAERDSNTGKMR